MTVIRHAALCDKGVQRKRNEDRYYIHEQRGLYFVTDGMANEVTPHVVVESLPPRIREEFGDDQRLTGGAAASGPHLCWRWCEASKRCWPTWATAAFTCIGAAGWSR